MTQDTEKLAADDCERCGQPKHRHIQDTGVFYCPVARFAFKARTPPTDTPDGELARELEAADYEWRGPFGREKHRIVPPELFGRILTRLTPVVAQPTPEQVREAAARAVHTFLSRRDIMQYLDNEEDCQGIAAAVLAAVPSGKTTEQVRETTARIGRGAIIEALRELPVTDASRNCPEMHDYCLPAWLRDTCITALIPQGDAEQVREAADQGCKVPPDGWWCSRKPGHEGPCAARPTAGDDPLVDLIREWLMSSDYPVSNWEREFAAAIRAALPKASDKTALPDDGLREIVGALFSLTDGSNWPELKGAEFRGYEAAMEQVHQLASDYQVAALSSDTALQGGSGDAVREGNITLVGEPCRLDDCPPGPFLFDGRLGFRSEYWTSSIKPDAYCMDSGEYFWGGTDSTMKRAALIVQPVEIAALSASPTSGYDTVGTRGFRKYPAPPISFDELKSDTNSKSDVSPTVGVGDE